MYFFHVLLNQTLTYMPAKRGRRSWSRSFTNENDEGSFIVWSYETIGDILLDTIIISVKYFQSSWRSFSLQLCELNHSTVEHHIQVCDLTFIKSFISQSHRFDDELNLTRVMSWVINSNCDSVCEGRLSLPKNSLRIWTIYFFKNTWKSGCKLKPTDHLCTTLSSENHHNWVCPGCRPKILMNQI